MDDDWKFRRLKHEIKVQFKLFWYHLKTNVGGIGLVILAGLLLGLALKYYREGNALITAFLFLPGLFCLIKWLER